MHHLMHGSGLVAIIVILLILVAVRGGSNSGDSK